MKDPRKFQFKLIKNANGSLSSKAIENGYIVQPAIHSGTHIFNRGGQRFTTALAKSQENLMGEGMGYGSLTQMNRDFTQQGDVLMHHGRAQKKAAKEKQEQEKNMFLFKDSGMGTGRKRTADDADLPTRKEKIKAIIKALKP